MVYSTCASEMTAADEQALCILTFIGLAESATGEPVLMAPAITVRTSGVTSQCCPQVAECMPTSTSLVTFS